MIVKLVALLLRPRVLAGSFISITSCARKSPLAGWLGGRAAAALATLLLLAWPSISTAAGSFTTNTYSFTYADREALLADGWSFLATTPGGLPRNTEQTNGSGAISYDQTNHPGVLRIPANAGDLWSIMNNTTNSLFRNLSSNWVSVRLEVASFQPTANYQQLRLALYQDDDNYVEIGRAFNGSFAGQGMQFVREDNGTKSRYSPMILAYTNFTATSFHLRLDRNPDTDAITGLYSVNGTNWVTLGGSSQAYTNSRLCIWAGSSLTQLPNCDLRRLDVITSDDPLGPLLVAQPQHLFFNTIAGQPCTNLQQVRVITRRTQNPIGFTFATNASWLVASASTADTNTPGSFDVAVDTSALSPGTYEGELTCTAPNATGSTVAVTLIVNPDARVRTSTWGNGKAGAMTVWIDDTQPTGFGLLTTNGYQGTYVLMELNPIPSYFSNYFFAGMELGSHTVIHDCPVFGEARTRFEFETNIVDICASTPQPKASLISFAYPCGLTAIPEQVVASDYFLVARGYNFNLLEDSTPYNFMNLKSFNSHENNPHQFNTNAPPNPADLKTVVDAAVAQGKWFNLVLHTLDNDDGAIAYSRTKDIWVATGGRVTKYVVQRDRTVVTNVVETTNTISFTSYRMPIEASPLRSFETAFDSQDALTFQVDLAGIASVARVTVDSAFTPFTSKVGGGKTNLLVNFPVSLTPQTVVLYLSNSAPVLPAQANTVAALQTLLTITNTATDLDVPVQNLSYSLLNPPAGAEIDTNGIIRWTPSEGQLFGTYTITTTVTDSGQPALSATNSFDVTVKRPLTVTADNQSRSYGTTNPVLTGTLLGVQPGDNITASYGTVANLSSTVGTYPIVPTLNDPDDKLGNYRAVTNVGSLTIYRANTAVSVGVSANPSATRSNVTLLAELTVVPPATGTPGGTVRFLVDGVNYSNAVAVSSGMATLTTSNLTHGYHTLSAQYSGDTNFNVCSNSLGGNLLINTTPTAGMLSLSAISNKPASLPLVEMLAKCGDLDADALSIDSVSSPSGNGGLVVLGGSAITYTPPAGYVGPDTFAYVVTDAFNARATNLVNATVWVNSHLVITNIQRMVDRNIEVRGVGIPELRYWVQASPDGTTWSSIATNLADTNGLLTCIDLNATNYPLRFYRTVTP